MDPNETLAALRLHFQKAEQASTSAEQRWELGQAVDYFQALDGWLSRGGFPPDAWSWIRDASKAR